MDPVGFLETGEPGMFNRYAYTWNDPINKTDPSGMYCLPCGVKAGELALLAAAAAVVYVGTQSVIDNIQQNGLNLSTGIIPNSSSSPSASVENRNQGNIGPVNPGAAGDIPDLGGMSPEEARDKILGGGFEDKGTTEGGSEKYYHPDGSRIQIGPNGEVKRRGPMTDAHSETGRKYRPAIGADGKPIPRSEDHETKEKVELLE